MPVSEGQLLLMTRSIVGIAVLVLASIAFVAELLPEFEAKWITMPALGLAIILGAAEILRSKRVQ